MFDESLEDIHMVIEAALIKRIGEPGKKLHTGRSRNDQVATDLLMWIRTKRERKSSISWTDLMRAFVKLAERSGTSSCRLSRICSVRSQFSPGPKLWHGRRCLSGQHRE